MHPKLTFSRKAVYAKWVQQDCLKWKRAKDELKSAWILLDKAKWSEAPCTGTKNDILYTVDPINLPGKDSFKGIALLEILRKWGGHICELALNSACTSLAMCIQMCISCMNFFTCLEHQGNMNGSQFELYALLGEVYGSGLPLGYLMLRSDNGEKGGKKQYLTRFLSEIQDKWNLSALFTLTDKDWSKINTFCSSYPDAKHQLCYWHCLRAIKTRLSILHRMPAYYNAVDAQAEFSWIDINFVPVHQPVCLANLLPNHCTNVTRYHRMPLLLSLHPKQFLLSNFTSMVPLFPSIPSLTFLMLLLTTSMMLKPSMRTNFQSTSIKSLTPMKQTLRMAQTGYLRMAKRDPLTPTMSSAQHHTRNKFSSSSQSTSANTHCFLNRTGHPILIQLNQSAVMLSLRCTHSVAHVALQRCGSTCGRHDTHHRSGPCGPARHPIASHGYGQQ